MKNIYKRRFLGILGFGLLFILIISFNPTKAEACHSKSIFVKKEHSKLEKLKCKVKGVFTNNNWKKEECAERVRDIKNNTSAKILYKKCMKE